MKIPETGNKKIDIGIIVTLSVVSTILIIQFILPWVNTKIQAMQSIEVITLFGVIATGIGATLPIIFYISKSSAKAGIELKVYTHRSNAIATCTIKNIGTKRITPQNVYLFVDEGVMRDGYYEFPFLLKHEENEIDCVLAKICKKEKKTYPVDTIDKDFKDIHNDFLHMNHLSHQSILFIDPGEQFSEDAVIRLPKNGVYRIICIFTSSDCECLCASRQFIIDEDNE